jgi:hypothetical protein
MLWGATGGGLTTTKTGARNSIGPDTQAQTSVDFLLGASIFLLAFIFVFAFIPGMFAPFQSNSDELTMTADRIAATLSESILVQNGSGTVMPGILNRSCIDSFKAAMNDPVQNEQVRNTLGLNASASGLYDLEVIIDEQDNPAPIVISHGALPGTTNVGQSKRFVMVRDSGATGIDRYPGRMAILTVRVW